MGSFKKHFRRKLKLGSGGLIDPGQKEKEKKDKAGNQWLGGQARTQAELSQAEADYGNIEKNTRDTYTQAAKKAGTYANTAEFQSGFGSELQAGVRGARTEAVRRINALRKAMGNAEEFKPEGFEQTQGNVTADKLAAAPAQEDSAPEEVAAPEPPAAETGNATQSVQSGKGLVAGARRAAALRRIQPA